MNTEANGDLQVQNIISTPFSLPLYGKRATLQVTGLSTNRQKPRLLVRREEGQGYFKGLHGFEKHKNSTIMKTKFVQPLIWALALALALPACKKGNGNEPDPYTPPAEGMVFLPVLVHKVDMERVKEIEKARGGQLHEVKHSDEGNYDSYTFKYNFIETDIQEIVYDVRTADKILLRAKVKVPIASAATDMKKLLKKTGFNNDHFLIKATYCNLVREDEEALFNCQIDDFGPGESYLFRQYDKQRKAMPTIKDLNGYWYDLLGKQNFKLPQVRNFETRYGSTLEREDKVKYGKYANQKIGYANFRTHAVHAPQIIRGYFFAWDDEVSPEEGGYVGEVLFIYSDPALGFYTGEIHKRDLPTREMLALFKKEGYKIEDVHWADGHYIIYFKNETKKLKYALRARSFDDIEGGRKIMALNLFRDD